MNLYGKIKFVVDVLNEGQHNIRNTYVKIIVGGSGLYQFHNTLGFDSVASKAIRETLSSIADDFDLLTILFHQGQWSISGEQWDGKGKKIAEFDSKGL